ncbi:Pimeloyl-ACP methyl ester carboxylesterase [Pedococcus cremeus]|uniref:Pimeloyl-ACP methyl ester carboxylesterase n=1 Tax=Pedococcus cremeus TaxID=587636 RepID=A0A1H9R3S3_9MICO|nr:alpha/beta hydrolase [Pedococcus cremeus]SER67348.1 Pimeloyl-ACP methyl ester carboxylesterase [Pedococcus cremeus]
MERRTFLAPTPHGSLAGWCTGAGEPVLLLHGGPGLEGTYLDVVADELAVAFEVATFQQRGLPPSTEEGPFTIDQAVADVEAVLDHLGWEQAWVVGHSWGGHLAFHFAVTAPGRLRGALSVDPLGAVGDGGMAQFEAELMARISPDSRARVAELEAREQERPLTVEERAEAYALAWPGYFADPEAAPPFLRLAQSAPAADGLFADIQRRLPQLEDSLPRVAVPLGVLVGEHSPIPPREGGIATAERVPGAWSSMVPGAGHYPWHERPGCVLEAVRRLAQASDGH